MVERVAPPPMVRGRRSSTRTVIGSSPSGPMVAASSMRIERKMPSRASRSSASVTWSGSKISPSGRSAMKAMKPGSVRRLPVTRVGPKRASRPGSRVIPASSRSVAWSATASRPVSAALARPSWRQRSIETAEAWPIAVASAGSPVA